MELVDENGNRYEMRLQLCNYNYVGVDRDGNVHHVHEDADGRVEWSAHISQSPLRDALPEWLWDLVLDPRAD